MRGDRLTPRHVQKPVFVIRLGDQAVVCVCVRSVYTAHRCSFASYNSQLTFFNFFIKRKCERSWAIVQTEEKMI